MRVYEGKLYVFGCGDETFESGQWAYGVSVGGKCDGRRGVGGDAVNIGGTWKRTEDECQLGDVVWGTNVLIHFRGLDMVSFGGRDASGITSDAFGLPGLVMRRLDG